MTEPVYFVVEKKHGREYATVQHEHLQRGGRAVYTLRLDKLPNPERWLAMPLAELYALYCKLRDAGQLPPPNIADAPKKAEPAKRLLGEYWEPPWVHDRPYPLIAAATEPVHHAGCEIMEKLSNRCTCGGGDGRGIFLKGGKQ
jgi:hypothetical protein